MVSKVWKMVWRDNLRLWTTGWPLALIVILGFLAAFQFVKPAPPKHLIMTVGGKDGMYYSYALRYQELFAKNGITLELLNSQGSGENLRRLRKNEAQIGFVQGGVPYKEAEDAHLLSLGSVFYEPLWVFTRDQPSSPPLSRLSQLEGRRIAIAQENTSTKALAYHLLEANEVSNAEKNMISTGEFQAAEALQQGRLDALFVIATPEAPVVQVLLRSPGIRLMSFSQAEAYHRRFPFLFRLIMPEGGVDLMRDNPPHDIHLLSTTANLVIQEDLHPALQTLMLTIMREVHGKSGYFHAAGEFPAYKDQGFPLSTAAQHFYMSGSPFLQRYMPFWLAVLADRFLILALPLFTLFVPFLRLAPAFYSWRVRSRICRYYGELKFLESDIRKYHAQSGKNQEEQEALRRRLDAIESRVDEISIPINYADMRYTLREHIHLVRSTLDRQEHSPVRSKKETPP